MLYSEFRNQIKSGDVLAWTHNGLKSWKDFEVWIVRLGQRSEYTHVAIAWVIGGRVFLLEAAGGAVRIFPLSRDLPCYHIGTNVTWTKEVEEYALSKIGEKYSKWEAIKGLFGLTTNDDQWQCSEFAREVLKKAGMDLDCIATPSAVVGKLLDNNHTLIKLNIQSKKWAPPGTHF